ncbi:MAG TPA: hypothetical protein VK083_14440 [Nocardia sp.]|uniref:hypothetical protein n=1 Tax=Nocardia TaxID=1817 RepID=UPI002457DFA8|nr:MULTISPECIES: hypothetical protein [Nocardia]HLS77979.1 hypothetical protein [Nocardia sp.]
MGRGGLLAGAAVAALVLGSTALGLTACGESAAPEPTQPTQPTQPTPPIPATTTTAPLSPEQRDNLRIIERLAELGCDTNSCIQTYFACEDGYLSGDPCDFYRRNPL